MGHSVLVTPSVELAKRVRSTLARANYYADPVVEAIGGAGQLALTRNHSIAALDALRGRMDALAVLITLFIAQESVPVDAITKADLTVLLECGFLSHSDQLVRSEVDVRPYMDETLDTRGWVVSDHTATLNTRNLPPRPNHVLGISSASISLSHITPRRKVGKALDLGTGCAIQCLALNRHVEHIVATDLNPRALALARWTLAINQIDADVREGSLFTPVKGETFDVISTNPPFVISPPSSEGARLMYRESAFTADGLMRSIVGEATNHLNHGGSLHVLGNWAHMSGEPWARRLESWVPQGCDAFIVQREVLDPYEYIEVWLADAGIAGTSEYVSRYEEWLDYFKQWNIEGVGMGWITMVKSGSLHPRVACVEWPHPVEQPVADDLMDHLASMEWRDASADDILARNWVLSPHATQETVGVPGEAHPQRVILRRGDGLKRAIEVDTALGGVLGACDGQLPLGSIVNAVAHVLDVPPSELTAEIMPKVRSLISETWLK